MLWKIIEAQKRLPNIKKPILIEGLPGIGNVGKIVVDFIIEELKAKKIYEFTSHTFPHSVFVNEKNLVELPKVEMYHVKLKYDLLLLAGDVQPIEEVPSYEFSELIVNMVKKYGGQEIITLGGIGLPNIPKVPNVYCTANSKSLISKYKKDTKIDSNLYGVVGPIIGATGLLVGLAGKENIPAICLLAETYAHPMFLGIKGSREILKILSKKLGLRLQLKKLDKEIKEIEAEMKKTDDFANVSISSAKDKLSRYRKSIDYIG